MAGPVLHALLAQTFLDTLPYSQEERESFLRGTLLPDIRYMVHIPRSATHVYKTTLDAVKKADPFSAGVLFHSFVDEERKKMAQEENILSLFDAPVHKKDMPHLLKIIEDDLAYDQLRKDEVLHALKTAEPFQDLSIDKIRAWQLLLSDYLKQPPHLLFQQHAKNGNGYFTLSSFQVAMWNGLIETYRRNPIFKTFVAKVQKKFDKIFIFG